MFKEVYAKVKDGNASWNSLEASDSLIYPWDAKSTYIKSPPFFDSMVRYLHFFALVLIQRDVKKHQLIQGVKFFIFYWLSILCKYIFIYLLFYLFILLFIYFRQKICHHSKE